MGPSIKAGRPSNAAQRDGEKQGTASGRGRVDEPRARQPGPADPLLSDYLGTSISSSEQWGQMSLSAQVSSSLSRPNIRREGRGEPWGECEELRDALTSWTSAQFSQGSLRVWSKGMWHCVGAGSPKTQV